jgi:RNase adaptor protein for sRNA GlmZ degradation
MELSDMLSREYLQEGGTRVEIEVESINVMHSLPVDSAVLDDIRASILMKVCKS